MGGRDFYCDLRPHSRYRTLFVDDELTPGVLPRSALTRLIAGFGLPLPILNLRSCLVGLGCLRGGSPRVVLLPIRRPRPHSPLRAGLSPGEAFACVSVVSVSR